jgi:hypothetical protein
VLRSAVLSALGFRGFPFRQSAFEVFLLGDQLANPGFRALALALLLCFFGFRVRSGFRALIGRVGICFFSCFGGCRFRLFRLDC